MLLDAKAPSFNPGKHQVPATAVTAKTWTTGYEGINEINLRLDFPPVLAGSRWFVVTSGQYFPDQTFDDKLFCDVGGQAIHEPNRIRCRDNPSDGSNDVEYRYDDQIGSPSGRDGPILAPIDSLIGFDADAAAVITGTVSSRADTPTSISIPYRTPHESRPGGDHLVRLAPIGVTDEEWGSLRPVGELATAYASIPSDFADVQSGQGLRYLPISSMRVDVDDDALGDGQQITVAMPATVDPDRLRWDQQGRGIGPLLYRLHDPASETHVGVYAFAAGLAVSSGVAALFLLGEQFLIRRQT